MAVPTGVYIALPAKASAASDLEESRAPHVYNVARATPIGTGPPAARLPERMVRPRAGEVARATNTSSAGPSLTKGLSLEIRGHVGAQ